MQNRNDLLAALAELQDAADYMSWRVGKIMSSKDGIFNDAITFEGVLKLQAGKIAQSVAHVSDAIKGDSL